MRHPGLLPNIKGGAYIAVFCDVCDEGFQARGHSIAGGRTHATKRHVCATPTATEYQGWRIHRVFCDVCDEGFQARGHSIAEIAHMPQNGMYAPPLGATVLG